MPALDPLETARAVLTLARLLYLTRQEARLRGHSLAGSPAVIANVGARLAREIAHAERLPPGAARDAAVRRLAGLVARLAEVVEVHEGVIDVLATAERVVLGHGAVRPPSRPPKPGR